VHQYKETPGVDFESPPQVKEFGFYYINKGQQGIAPLENTTQNSDIAATVAAATAAAIAGTLSKILPSNGNGSHTPPATPTSAPPVSLPLSSPPEGVDESLPAFLQHCGINDPEVLKRLITTAFRCPQTLLSAQVTEDTLCEKVGLQPGDAIATLEGRESWPLKVRDQRKHVRVTF